MERSLIAVRTISADERKIIERAIRFAPASGAEAISLSKLDSLQVVGKCPCGCASIDFHHTQSDKTPRLIADAIGETASGAQVSILVFALDDEIVTLEIVSFDAHPASLPVPSTVRDWDGTGAEIT